MPFSLSRRDCPLSRSTTLTKLPRHFPAAIALSLALASLSVSAGFLEDFYDQAGAQTSVTRAGVYESQNRRLATGASFVLKAPRKTFTPFTLDAPSLKSGCGGIDFFLGAFSVPSREEFVSFARSIGTAIPGLAFHLALQSMSPDLNEQITEFRDMIMELTGNFSDSCKAAQWAVDKTASAAGWMSTMQHRSVNALRASGEASDASDADRLTRTNGSKVLDNAPDRTDSGGEVVESSEMNLTWSLLKGGKLGSSLDQETLETMMTMLGTAIYSRTGSGESATVRTRGIGGRDILWDLMGSVDEDSPKSAVRLVCDEPQKCLNPKENAVKPVNLVRRIWLAAHHYRQSLVSRNPAEVDESEIVLLANISSIPLLSLIEASASARIPAAGHSMTALFAEAAAHEAITTALMSLADDIRRVIAGSSGRDANAVTMENARHLEDRLQLILADLHARSSRLYEAMARAQSYAAQARHIERSVWGRSAVERASALPGKAFAANGSSASGF